MKLVVKMDCNQTYWSVFIVNARTKNEAFEKALRAFVKESVKESPALFIAGPYSIIRDEFCYSVCVYPIARNGVVEVNRLQGETIYPNEKNKVHPIIAKVVDEYGFPIKETKRLRRFN